MTRRRRRWVWLFVSAAVGCTSVNRPDNGIRGGLPAVPAFVPAATQPGLPAPPDPLPPPPADPKKEESKDGGAGNPDDRPKAAAPVIPPGGVLSLDQVLTSVNSQFPLLLAAVLDRNVADGQVLAAEGQFDTVLRARGSKNAGTFPVSRFDFGVDQPTAVQGINLFSGYRLGDGNFPGYNGGQETADGGELRTGISVPLLRDAAIDKRRATARLAGLSRLLAEPGIQRARIDYFLAAARAYWNWVAAAEQVRVQQDLLRIATVRQEGLDLLAKGGAQAEFNAFDNKRTLYEREERLAAAERVYQAAALDLSQYVRDANGDPVVPPASAAPMNQPERTDDVPAADQLPALVEEAGRLRPELQRLALQKERLSVELKLAENQTLPGLNLILTGAQDVGNGKRTSGSSALDRTNLEAAVLFEVPLQRRDPLGRIATARAQMAQLVRQEQFARDRIQIEIQDAVANLDRTRVRIEKSLAELKQAELMVDLELTRQRRGATDILVLNIRELTAATARSKVIDAVAEFRRARAALRAALGQDAQREPPASPAPTSRRP